MLERAPSQARSTALFSSNCLAKLVARTRPAWKFSGAARPSWGRSRARGTGDWRLSLNRPACQTAAGAARGDAARRAF
eukprot:6937815-Pyramimonas_sp.AAC.1